MSVFLLATVIYLIFLLNRFSVKIWVQYICFCILNRNELRSYTTVPSDQNNPPLTSDSVMFQLKTCFLLIFIIDAAACVFTAPYAYHVELARVSDAEDAVSENSIWIQISTVTVTTLEQ